MSDCNQHPDAPHGFDRTASLNEDRYVCDCESWSEKYADRIPRESDLRTRIAAVLADHRIESLYMAFRCSCLPNAWLATRSDCDLHLANAVIRELQEGYVLVPKNVTLVQWADEAFKDQPEGKFKHERITEWEPTDD